MTGHEARVDGADWVPEGAEFALCLTHDIDRPYKSYQALYYALQQRSPRQVLDVLPWRNPYWTFEDVEELERDLGVRSAFYVLSEQSLFGDRSPAEWLDPEAWRLYAGRYDLGDPAIVDLIQRLEAGGWEIGLHGSYEAVDDPERLRSEKARLDVLTEEPILGGRQHYFRLERPETWEHYRELGLSYDASLGDPQTVGFQEGYHPVRPFDDGFVVFPLTIMEAALPDPATDWRAAWETCEALLAEAAEHEAVMTVLWHPRYFCESDHPGFAELYRQLVAAALDRGAWVGSPGQLYAERVDAASPDIGLEAGEGATRKCPPADATAETD